MINRNKKKKSKKIEVLLYFGCVLDRIEGERMKSDRMCCFKHIQNNIDCMPFVYTAYILNIYNLYLCLRVFYNWYSNICLIFVF